MRLRRENKTEMNVKNFSFKNVRNSNKVIHDVPNEMN